LTGTAVRLDPTVKRPRDNRVILFVADLLAVPDGIRGYENVKLKTLQTAKQKVTDLVRRLEQVSVS